MSKLYKAVHFIKFSRYIVYHVGLLSRSYKSKFLEKYVIKYNNVKFDGRLWISNVDMYYFNNFIRFVEKKVFKIKYYWHIS